MSRPYGKGKLKPADLAEDDRDYFLERRYPAFGNLVPRDVASRAAKERCDEGFGGNATQAKPFIWTSPLLFRRYGKEQGPRIKGLDENDAALGQESSAQDVVR